MTLSSDIVLARLCLLPHTGVMVVEASSVGRKRFNGYGIDSNLATAEQKALSEFFEKNSADVKPAMIHRCNEFLLDPDMIRYDGLDPVDNALGVPFTRLSDGLSGILSAKALISAEMPAEAGKIPHSTAGYAGHVSINRAILTAIKEVVERHVFFCYWYGDRSGRDLGEPLPEFRLISLPNLSPWKICAAIKRSGSYPGEIVGIGAAFSQEAAAKKALVEAEFFEWWFLRDSSMNTAKTSTFSGLLRYFALSDQLITFRLLEGYSDPGILPQLSIKAIRKNFWLRHVAHVRGIHGRLDTHVVQAIAPGLIPQHCATGLPLSVRLPLFALPDSATLSIVDGVHPLT